MAIKYKVIERNSQPGNAAGAKKFYASTNSSGEANIEQITQSIEKISTVSGADIRAVLYALVDVMTGELANGKIVRLGELGSLRVSISSEGKDSAEEITSTSIIGQRILFTPGSKLKDTLKTLKYEKG